MKLKTYQKEVLADLKNYLEHLRNSNDLREAFRQHWLDRSIDPHTKNNDLLHAYNNSLAPGIPNVTLKVPTAGGKPYEKYVIKDLNGYVTADSLCLSNKYGDTPCVYEGVLVK